MNVILCLSPAVSVVSLGKSSHHCISFDSLRMINSVGKSSSKSSFILQQDREGKSDNSSHHFISFDLLCLDVSLS